MVAETDISDQIFGTDAYKETLNKTLWTYYIMVLNVKVSDLF